VTGIADTGFLVAFAKRKYRHHDWAVEVALRIDRALLTCDAVLAETAFHLKNLPLVLAMVEEGLVLPQLQVSDHLPGWPNLPGVTRTASRISPTSSNPPEQIESFAAGHHHGCAGFSDIPAWTSRDDPSSAPSPGVSMRTLLRRASSAVTARSVAVPETAPLRSRFIATQ
jgi:hypothetical protein